MILIIDNYDSFTYNLAQSLGELGAAIHVRRNDRITADEVEELSPKAMIISPGPGGPMNAKASNQLIKTFMGRIPILGVCLGHQCIGHIFGARIVSAKELMHGKTAEIRHHGSSLYQGISSPFVATGYHSLIVERESLPKCLEVTAETPDGDIMGLRHKELDVEGVQFHPASILTTEGEKILGNFLRRLDRSNGTSNFSSRRDRT